MILCRVQSCQPHCCRENTRMQTSSFHEEQHFKSIIREVRLCDYLWPKNLLYYLHWQPWIVPLLYHYCDFYPVKVACALKSPNVQNRTLEIMTPFHLCKVGSRSRSKPAKTSKKVSNANIWLVVSALAWKRHQCGSQNEQIPPAHNDQNLLMLTVQMVFLIYFAGFSFYLLHVQVFPLQ